MSKISTIDLNRFKNQELGFTNNVFTASLKEAWCPKIARYLKELFAKLFNVKLYDEDELCANILKKIQSKETKMGGKIEFTTVQKCFMNDNLQGMIAANVGCSSSRNIKALRDRINGVVYSPPRNPNTHIFMAQPGKTDYFYTSRK